MYINGEFNIDLLKYEINHDSTIVFDITHSYGLYQMVNKPTRKASQISLLIDSIYTNDLSTA